ncbi:Glu/Leu/Phe/Val family dehydrogenase [Nocardia thraciensis]
MIINIGGAKGGVAVDPHSLTVAELEALTRSYTREIFPVIGAEKDIPAPDVGTDAQTMAWIMDAYSGHVGYSVPGLVTGKPVALGGSHGRHGATSRGVALCALATLKQQGKSSDGATVAVQGFGKVGALAAQYLADAGCRVVAVSDVDGARHNSNGIDLAAAQTTLTAGARSISEVDGLGDHATNDELLTLDVDILVPAALENVITSANAAQIQASIIVEGANGPTTPDADEILQDKGCIVVPDILANAGGVVVSYLEWVQNLQAYSWSSGDIDRRLKDVISNAYDGVQELSHEQGITLRQSVHAIGVGRVAEAMRLRGLTA